MKSLNFANPVLRFNKPEGLLSQKFKSSTNKIGWLHSISDNPGATFDLEIKDALGRTKLRKINCGNGTERYGELVNLEVMIGEDLEVVLDNVKGADEISMFLN